MKKYSFAVVIILVLFSLTGCSGQVTKDMRSTANVSPQTNNDKGSNNIDDITYTNEKYGFSLVFPGYWKNQYYVEDVHDIGVRIHYRPIWLENGSGTLFQITVFNKAKDEWNTQGKTAVETVGLRKIYEDDKEVFGFSCPTDVQYITNDKNSYAEYMKMENDVLTKIVQTFKKQKRRL